MDPFTLAGITFTGIVAGVFAIKILTPPKVALQYRWPAPPRVIRTEHCPFTGRELEDAVLWWAERGAKFATFHVETVPALTPEDGDILCELRDQSGWREDHMGHTEYPTVSDHDILRAKCTFPTDVRRLSPLQRAFVARHEIGHAIGFWEHVDRRGHALASSTSRGGDGDAGIREALASSTAS